MYTKPFESPNDLPTKPPAQIHWYNLRDRGKIRRSETADDVMPVVSVA